MKCQYFQKNAALFIGGELSSQKTKKLHKHLDQCMSCRKYFENLQISKRLFSKAIREQSIAPLDQSFTESVMNHIPDKQLTYITPRKTSKLRLTWAGPAAALVITFAFFIIRGFIMNKPQSEDFDRFPLVEKTEPNITVMTFQIDDPKITIVWFFENDNNNNKENDYAM